MLLTCPARYQGSTDTTLIPGDEGEPTNCPRCSGKVSQAFNIVVLVSEPHFKNDLKVLYIRNTFPYGDNF